MSSSCPWTGTQINGVHRNPLICKETENHTFRFPLVKSPGMDFLRFYKYGGELVSTGIEKLRLHTEVPLARKTGGINTNADDYAYALAA